MRKGDAAPLFTSVLHTGERFSLTDFRGRKNVVLFFYPRDFTPGCSTEVCAVRDNLELFNRLEAVVVGVSYDGAESHARFAHEMGLTFPLITDHDRSISKAYGAERLIGRPFGPKRMTVVIDKQGIVRSVDRGEFDPGGLVAGALQRLAGSDISHDEE